jgi:hypothetical protein
MNTRTRAGAGTTAKIAGFVAVLAVVFGGAWAAGAQVGPVGSTSDQSDDSHSVTHSTGLDSESPKHAEEDGMNAKTDPPSGGTLPGLAVAQDGYRLVLTDTVLTPGTRPIAFTIDGPDGRPVTAFDVEHGRKLHLIAVRRDHAGFQHLHPTLDESTGTWTADAELAPGQWRVFADFTATGGPALVLGSDLLVPGQLDAPGTAQETRTDVVDGYTVTVDGKLRPGEHSSLTLRVTKDGAPVTDLQPYLGAYGHLVALREGDLAYLHVHPGGEPGDGETKPGPDIDFGAEVPSAGRYHLYFDFRHDDVVRTAHFVLDAGPTNSTGDDSRPSTQPDAEADSDGGHGDAGHAH